MADVFHVGTYLVSTASLQAALDERGIAEALQYAPMGDSGFACVTIGWEDGHALAVAGVTADVALNTTFVLREMSPNQRIVASMGIMVKKLLTQMGLGIGCLCHDKQSAGILIDAVDKSDAGVVGVVSRQTTQMPGDGIDQRTVKVTHAGMHDHACRLVDDHELIIFIDDVKGNILWLDGGIIVRTVKHQRDDIARSHLVIALHRTAVISTSESPYPDIACIGSLLNTVSRSVLHVLGQEFINAQRLLSAIYFDTEMLEELLRIVLQLEVT